MKRNAQRNANSKEKNNSHTFTSLINEDSTLKTEVYLKEVVFVLHHEGI